MNFAGLTDEHHHHPTLAVNIKDESFFKELGSRIALARKARNLTQTQLAEALGVTQQTVQAYESALQNTVSPCHD